MTATSDAGPAIAPSVIAGLLLAAHERQRQLGFSARTVEQIVEKTGASRSSAYEVKARLLEVLPSLMRPVGRPPAPPSPPSPTVEGVTRHVLHFVMDHPGCVHGGPQRRVYADSFRRLVLDLHQKHPDFGVEELARAVEVPLDTLRDWLRVPVPPEREPSETDPTAWKTSNLHLQTVLAEWDRWEGGFVPFCEHVREHLRVPYGRTAIAAILEAYGVRLRKKREGRSPDEIALREAFQTFFPGAQWVGDGTPLVVHVFGQAHTFNLGNRCTDPVWRGRMPSRSMRPCSRVSPARCSRPGQPGVACFSAGAACGKSGGGTASGPISAASCSASRRARVWAQYFGASSR